jgi:putative O-methyltransferase
MMSSTNVVNFSLRQNKSIERTIVFECLSTLIRDLYLKDLVYVGLGSVWFTDFNLAHRLLGIETMISIEENDVIFKRATFNRPFRTLEILMGRSVDVIPELLTKPELKDRPWVVWLDYDEEMDESKLEELVRLIRTLPSDSVLLTTFSALGAKYGAPKDRADRIRDLFGTAAPEPISNGRCKDRDRLTALLALATENYLTSQAIDSGRKGSFVPAINLIYSDSSPMVTIGGVLPAPGKEHAVRLLVSDPNWPGRVGDMIETAPLTPKEVLALQSLLPVNGPVTRDDVIKMGFDLHDHQIRSFVSHYLRYPQFAQVAQ